MNISSIGLNKSGSLLVVMLSCFLIVNVYDTFAQTEVKIDHLIERRLGDNTSELSRDKFFRIHETGKHPQRDKEQVAFYKNYNAFRGRRFWGPFNKQDAPNALNGVYPTYTPRDVGITRQVDDIIATQHPRDVIRYNLDSNAAGDYAADYYLNGPTTIVPKYFEPMNEPFVHSKDAELWGRTSNANAAEQKLMKTKMSEWYRDIAKAIHSKPELNGMNVIGYSAAWASLELWDFGHFKDNQQRFMDIAGGDMDAFATHLYDGVNVEGSDSRRSGSNSEAILDLIETYSYVKWGIVKPHAISEFGAIEKGYGPTYSDVASVQTVKSINNIMFGLMEREDKILITIPFITGKAVWHINKNNFFQPYPAALWNPKDIPPYPTTDAEKNAIKSIDKTEEQRRKEQTYANGWVYTARILFYELWKDVKGKRVMTVSNNPDIQTQAFIDGSTVYFALNNLADGDIEVKINSLSTMEINGQVSRKSIVIDSQLDPDFSTETFVKLPESIKMKEGQTTIFTIPLTETPIFKNHVTRTKYYSKDHLQAITNGKENVFGFDGISNKNGYGIIRLSFARPSTLLTDKSKFYPTVKLNGKELTVPKNWKGYDQSNREDFFGMIEIPFNASELKSLLNNVSVRFNGEGGRISSVILSVESFDKEAAIDGITFQNSNDNNGLDGSTSGTAPTGFIKQEQDDLKVYPNPFDNVIHLKLKNSTILQEEGLIVYNQIGRPIHTILWETAVLETKINTTSWKSGIYFMEIPTAQGIKRIKILK